METTNKGKAPFVNYMTTPQMSIYFFEKLTLLEMLKEVDEQRIGS